MIAVSTFWTYWGVAEMYHEGWWGSWRNRLPYLAPIAVTLIPTLMAFRWPIAGGAAIIAIGIGALGFFSNDVAFIGLAVALVGVLFVWDGMLKRRHPPEPPDPSIPWWPSQVRYVIAVGLPLLAAIAASVYYLPIVLTRQDDGDRSERLIEGNDVSLVWAPEGPGWNYKQPWGGYPSWDDIALYGLEPIGFDDKPGYGRQEDGDSGSAGGSDGADGAGGTGTDDSGASGSAGGAGSADYVHASGTDMAATNVCLYLSEDGLDLEDTRQGVWRMPTTDEIVRSLGRHGENAGCAWDGEVGVQVKCEIVPDKESPLWSTEYSPIYYWSADEADEDHGFFVAFNGTVNDTLKSGGNPRHSYRCVREP
jgi:uncharacterized membrane protein